MVFKEIIARKRDGHELRDEEIAFFIRGVTDGTIPDYQIAALLMAIYLRGMTDRETVALTREMMHSGEVLDLSDIPGPKVDKHSTGGVGDKISLPLAPLVASLGVVVPMISGRALGHTGGTLDKLESIPGYRTDLSVSEFKEALRTVGVAIIGQTGELAPADRRLYALRDATATVSSIPLITSSILSKKLAEGIDGLVLDVKTGSGAFMRRYEDARALARSMVAITQGVGKKVVALITNMDQPLGWAVGNALEVVEAVEILQNRGPEDTTELTKTLAVEMLLLAGRARTPEDARQQVDQALASGRAYAKWQEMVRHQGGDPEAVLQPEFIRTRFQEPVAAPESGYLAAYDTYALGMAATVLGAGRLTKEDRIDPAVGLRVFKKVGDRVEQGEPLLEIRANDPERLRLAREHLAGAFRIAPEPVDRPKLVLERLA